MAAIILNKGKLLVVKEFNENHYHTAGGGVEEGEDLEKALRRELSEEIGVEVKSVEYFGKFMGKTYDGDELLLNTFITEISGEPRPGAEIENIAWVGAENGIKLTTPSKKQIIPKLIETGLMK